MTFQTLHFCRLYTFADLTLTQWDVHVLPLELEARKDTLGQKKW